MINSKEKPTKPLTKKRLYLSLLTGGISEIALFYCLNMFAGPFIIAALCSRYTGFDGLGCAITSYFAGIVLFTVIAALVVTYIMKKFLKVPFLSIVIPVSTSTIVSNAALVGLTTVTVQANYLYDITIPARVGIAFIAATMMMVIGLRLFKRKQYLGWCVGIVVCGALSTVVYLGANSVSGYFKEAKYIQAQKDDLSELTFKVYEPTYVTNGYQLRLASMKNLGVGVGPGFMTKDAESNQPAYFYFDYFVSNPANKFEPGGDYNEYTIYEYADSKKYTPTTSCNTTIREIESVASSGYLSTLSDQSDRPCESIGTSSKGCAVFYAEHPVLSDDTENISSNKPYAFCRIGSTIVMIASDEYYMKSNLGGNRKVEMVKIFNSLQLLTDDQVRNYAVDRYNKANRS